MSNSLPYCQFEALSLKRKLKWLTSIRLLFAFLMMGSTIAYQIGNNSYALEKPFIFLYGLSGAMVVLSAVYGVYLSMVRRYQHLFIYGQITIDALCITLIIFVTGGYSSVFSFLYLVVVIYSSVFVFKRGSLLMAAFCSIQFILLLLLEFNGTIEPYGYSASLVTSAVSAVQMFQKTAILTAACFSVAFLSGYLADQERQSKVELVAMGAQLDRVKYLAQIGEMAAGLAHEIKNPLASISGAIQILKGDMDHDTDNMRLMHIVLRETDRLSGLVNNFLTFARPSAGQTKPVDLGEALAEIVSLFEKDSTVNQRIILDLDIISDIYVEIDPLQLRQVIWNLLLNGAEAIDHAGKIKISAKKLKNERVKVEIADEGCGMEEDTLNSIFNPFYTTKTKGTGLGLSIVYRILETYGCRMDVQSKPGQGSVFTLYFKMIDPASQSPS